MRILELEIHNVRGVCHLQIQPQGKNFVLWGPNGSGKSAVVDAVDFLLTGAVTRLTGKGTGDITLNRHGPHIDHTPDEARVRAVIQLPGLGRPVEIARCMAQASRLECDAAVATRLKPVLTLAGRGQHVLTRREILRFITAEPSSRAQEIQALLNITDVESTRKALVTVSNTFWRNVEVAKRGIDTAKAQVCATLGETTFQPDRALAIVNEKRAILKGRPITRFSTAELKKDLRAPLVLAPGLLVDLSLFAEYASNLRATLPEERQAQVAVSDANLRTEIAQVRSDSDLERAFHRQELIKLGMALIDENGACPLCDTPWQPGELRSYLEKRQAAAELAAQQHERISHLSSDLLQPTDVIRTSVQSVIQAARSLGIQPSHVSTLESWLNDLRTLVDALSSPLDKYPDDRYTTACVQRFLAPSNLAEILDSIEARLHTQHPPITPEQKAWDMLTALEQNLGGLELAQARHVIEVQWAQRASTLLQCFEQARDAVLGKLYDQVRDRFVELYRTIHGADEDRFQARLQPAGAGLDFEVDFYGRGAHPPHALHSEGHQDCMGLCLFLALSDKLTQGILDLVILDDVMMSIDADHRRELCHLLAKSFPHRQFLITTHDRTWATQLKTEGVVNSKGYIEFYNWCVETGPQVCYEADLWTRIEDDLKKHDVPAAAAKLRHGAEGFFANVCDSLRVPVIYKSSHRWDLGDLLSPAIGQYQDLLKKAKVAAKSWDKQLEFDALDELSSVASQVITRSGVEQWAINANVHYSEWANFLENDFRPVVDAFRDLFGLFACSTCGAVLRVATVGPHPVSVSCTCGQVDWHLQAKGKT